MKTNNRLAFLFVSLLATSCLPATSFGGIKWIDVGVNGLTCSMCSRSVEMSVRRLDFVDSVSMSLEKTEGRIYFKPGALVNLKKITEAVVDAGFSVRFLRLEFNFTGVPISPDGSFIFQGQSYQWLEFKEGSVSGDVALKLVDEGFLPRKESSLWKKKLGPITGAVRQKVLHVVRET